MNNHYSHSYLFLIVVFGFGSCTNSVKTFEDVHKSNGSPWTTEDLWYILPPDSYGSREVIIPRKHLHELDSAHAPVALKMLENSSIIPLTRKEAADFGAHPDADEPLKPYLVRALTLNYETGGYEVGVSGDTIVVEHGSLGRGSAPMTRSSLIVELKNEPHVLYVVVSMAE
jgi:hypothetical protein